MDEAYGRSPAVNSLEWARWYNSLPMEERARVSAEFVRRRIEEGEDED
jgi:hypothetical protein